LSTRPSTSSSWPAVAFASRADRRAISASGAQVSISVLIESILGPSRPASRSDMRWLEPPVLATVALRARRPRQRGGPRLDVDGRPRRSAESMPHSRGRRCEKSPSRNRQIALGSAAIGRREVAFARAAPARGGMRRALPAARVLLALTGFKDWLHGVPPNNTLGRICAGGRLSPIAEYPSRDG